MKLATFLSGHDEYAVVCEVTVTRGVDVRRLGRVYESENGLQSSGRVESSEESDRDGVLKGKAAGRRRGLYK